MRWTITPPQELDLAKVDDAVKQATLDAMRAGVMLVVNEAKRSVARGPKTGRVYRRHNVEHQASAPGQPPATDTGILVNSIGGDAELKGGVVMGYIRAKAAYAAWLELGTRRMGARPFIVPAVTANRDRILQLVRSAFQTGVRRFARK